MDDVDDGFVPLELSAADAPLVQQEQLYEAADDEGPMRNVATAKRNDVPLKTRQLFALSSFWFGYMVYWFVVLIVAVPSEVSGIVGDDNKGFGLFVLFIVGGVINLVVSVVLGYVTDRVYSPFGRRFSWIIAGTVINVPFTLLLAVVGDLGWYTVVYSFVTITSVVVSVPYNGLFADVVSSSQRGKASAIMGALGSLGNLCGAALGLMYTTIGGLGTYGVLVAVWIVCTVITYIGIKEPPFTREDVRRIKMAEAVTRGRHMSGNTRVPYALRWAYASVLYPLFEPMIVNVDFRWVFATRFLMQMGQATVQEFLQYWLKDCVELPEYNGERISPETAVSVVFLPLLICATISALVGGTLSDRLGNRRKILIFISGGLMVGACLAFMFIRDFYVGILGACVFGSGYGAFLSVDFAIVMDVLPSEDDVARDVALWHLALVIPQVAATPVAGLLLDHFQAYGDSAGIECLGYTIIWILAAVYIVSGTGLISRIKKIR